MELMCKWYQEALIRLTADQTFKYHKHALHMVLSGYQVLPWTMARYGFSFDLNLDCMFCRCHQPVLAMHATPEHCDLQ